MRILSGFCLCLLTLYIQQTSATTWTLLETSSNGFATANWQCVSGTSACTTYPTPNNAQSLGVSQLVILPSCATATQTALIYATDISKTPVLWPSIQETGFCYSFYISGQNSTFSTTATTGPLPSLYFPSDGNDVSVEQQQNDLLIPVLDIDNFRTVTIAGANIRITNFVLTKATTVTFKKLLATSVATAGVELQNTTVVFTSDVAISSVWQVNSASGITFTQNFRMASPLTSNYQLTINNQANAGMVIRITAPTFSVSDGKLNLKSVTAGGNSSIASTAVTLANSATINLSGIWAISSLASFSGVGTLDLSTALPLTGFVLPSTHTDHTIKLAANSILLATGSFTQVILTGPGPFTVDRNNLDEVMDINTITTTGTNPGSVTLRNGKFRVSNASGPIFLESAELTVVGPLGVQINGDASSTVIFDSSTVEKTPPVNCDGFMRVWNHEYILYSQTHAGKGIFVEKKSYAYRIGDSLADTMTVDDATFAIKSTFVFGAPIIIQNSGVLNIESGAVLDITNTNVSLFSGGQVICDIDFTPLNDVTFGTKGLNQGEFLSYRSIVVGSITFTTDNLALKENASLIIEAGGVVSASSLYVAPSTWVDFVGSVQLTGDFVNDGEVYWGGKEAVGNSALTGHYAQNANGTTFLSITSLNDTQPVGEYDTLSVTGDVYLFGTLKLEFADPDAALALPDEAWYPFITLTGFSGGVFDKVEHNLGEEVMIDVCFTDTQGILVIHHNTTTSTAEFAALPEYCDFVNPVPVSVPGGMEPTEPVAAPGISSAIITVTASYIVLLAAVLLQTVC